MKTKTALTILLLFTANVFAQDRMAEALRNGILEEDAKQNVGAAIQQYQAVMTQFADARQTAANALFRMAECYRKRGNQSQAIAAYQRVLKEFADQSRLAEQSRVTLAKTYNVTTAEAPGAKDQVDRAKYEKLLDWQTEELAKIKGARARYEAIIQQEIGLAQKQLSSIRQRQKGDAGSGSAGADLQETLGHLKRDLADFDADMTSPPPTNGRMARRVQ